MSLSIDYITMPPKSQEVSQIQGAETTKNNLANQELASQFQQQVKHESQTTIRRADVENDELNNDERNQKRNKKKGSNGKEEEKEEPAKQFNSDGSVRSGGFDMRI